ncbi:MAG: hypothetical protein JEZ07_15920 [Phycisphaerae bacterium]|nr:hypothetical protein [Phycisphaerae bacterium]
MENLPEEPVYESLEDEPIEYPDDIMEIPPEPCSTTGQRIAAGVMVTNAVLSLILMMLDGFADDTSSKMVGPYIFDIVLGISIFSGNHKWVKLAIIRVFVGIFIWIALALAQENTALAILQFIYGASLLILMFGNPKKVRLSIGCGMASIIALMWLSAFQLHFSGYSFINNLLLKNTYDLVDAENELLVNESHNYSFGPISSGWQQRKRAAVIKEMPVATNWFVNPKYDAHIAIITEKIDPDYIIDHVEFVKVVIENASNLDGFSVISKKDISTEKVDATILNTTANLDDLMLKYRYGLFSKNNIAVQIICWSSIYSFDNVQDDFSAAIDSFKFDDDFIMYDPNSVDNNF